jgi:hypothetical protein
VSVLLRQPDCVKCLGPGIKRFYTDDEAIIEGPDLVRAVLNRDPISSGAPVRELDEHLVAQVEELYRITEGLLPVGPDLNKGLLYRLTAPTADGFIDGRDPYELDLGVVGSYGHLSIVAITRLKALPDRLYVLLRHRPRSIPQEPQTTPI